jgi:hypothetical protein
VVPVERRPRIRPELAFEFVSFLRFLEGAQSLGTEMAIHDHIQHALAGPAPPATLVFSIETRTVAPDTHLLIAQQTEKLAMSMIQWMAEKDGQ